MKYKLSPFHSNNTKPVHIGIYQILAAIPCYSYYDGHWHCGAPTIKKAFAKKRRTKTAFFQNVSWRGIVK